MFKYFQNQQYFQNPKLVRRNNSCAAIVKDGKKTLLIWDSHTQRIKKCNLYIKYSSHTTAKDLHHDIVTLLLKEKLTDKIVNIGKISKELRGVSHILLSSIYVKSRLIYVKWNQPSRAGSKNIRK